MELLLNIQRKTELFASFINELENAKADIDNECNFHKIDKEIIEGFFRLYKKMDKESIEKLQKKIQSALATLCDHDFSGDIESAGNYCLNCGIICE